MQPKIRTRGPLPLLRALKPIVIITGEPKRRGNAKARNFIPF